MVLAQLEVETIELVIPKSDEVVEEQTQIEIFLIRTLRCDRTEKGGTPKAKQEQIKLHCQFQDEKWKF